MVGRKIFTITLWLAALSPSLARAESTARSNQEVGVVVAPNITIGNGGGWSGVGSATTSYVDLGQVDIGAICGYIRWRVDSNAQTLRFALAASDLWKGGDPNTASVPPIPLYTQSGAEFDIEYGNPTFGNDSYVQYNSQTTIGDFPAWQTEFVTFESSQNGHFSQYVTTRVCWFQDDPAKPMGQYKGMVELWGLVVPSF